MLQISHRTLSTELNELYQKTSEELYQEICAELRTLSRDVSSLLLDFAGYPSMRHVVDNKLRKALGGLETLDVALHADAPSKEVPRDSFKLHRTLRSTTETKAVLHRLPRLLLAILIIWVPSQGIGGKTEGTSLFTI